MDRSQIESTVIKVVSTVLKEPASPSTERAGTAKWDSLKHIEIMFALEDAFDIEFNEEELAELNSIAAIVNRIIANAS